MGDMLDYCEKLLLDESFEGVPVFQKENNNNTRINKMRNKKKSIIKMNDVIFPINSNDENYNSQCVSTNKLKNTNKNINTEENVRISSINKNECGNGAENDLIISKMSQKIEILENKNKILEDEKKEIKKENEELIKKIELYKETITKFKNNSNNEKENVKIENNNSNKIINVNNNNKNKPIKIIFLFKNNKNQNINDNQREEIMAYKYEMFLEVKMRLLNIRHLQPGDIKYCYYNSKEINDWFTLEDLNISDNSYVICEQFNYRE